ncbi:MAG TPA: TPM domain-containing protein, partial [Polyangiales bacterium]
MRSWGRWLPALLLWALLLPPAGRVRALDVPALQGPVNDHAGLLTSDEQRALASKLRTHQQATGHELTLLTVPSLDGDEIAAFSIRVAEAWKLGSEKGDNGLILVVARDDRK